MNDTTSGHTVELGPHTFSAEEWETISAYAKGYHASRERESSLMQRQVRAFHRAMKQPVGLWPRPLPAERVPVRIELIREEFEDELIPALEHGDMVETVDACVDILYVTLGLLVEMGVNVSAAFNEVQDSNMSKLGADGMPIIAQENDPDGVFPGRVKKGPDYFRPDLRMVLSNGGLSDLGQVQYEA